MSENTPKTISEFEGTYESLDRVTEFYQAAEKEQKQGFTHDDFVEARTEFMQLANSGELPVDAQTIKSMDEDSLLGLIDQYTSGTLDSKHENTPSLTTQEGRVARLRKRMGGYKDASSLKMFQAAQVPGKFSQWASSKESTHSAKGNILRKTFYSTMGALGIVGATATAARASGLGFHEIASISGVFDGPSGGQQHASLLDQHAGNTQDDTSGTESSIDTGSTSETPPSNHDFHFFDDHKESEHAFGKAGDDSSVEKALEDMQDRYMGEDGKGDPALVAAHAKELGLYDNLNVNELANKLQDNEASMKHAVEMLKEIDGKSNWKIIDSPSNYGSLYMTEGPDGKPNVYFDSAVEHTNPGKALVQTDANGNIKCILRIDCGFQPLVEHKPVDVPTREELTTPPPVEHETPTPTHHETETPTKEHETPSPTTTETPSPTHQETPSPTTTETPSPTHQETPSPTLEPKKPEQDPDVNTGIEPIKSTEDDPLVPSGEQKPATPPPAEYVAPEAPDPTPVERPDTTAVPEPEPQAPTSEKPADKPTTNPF